jgi:hypothetical protein
MNIIVVKLTTGDEVIGKMTKNSAEGDEGINGPYITLETVRTLVMQQAESGQIGLGMMPFMPSADNPSTDSESDIKIYTKFIVAEPTNVPKDLEDAYVRSTSKIAIV